MISDDDREVDVESDDGDDSDTRQSTSRQSSGSQYYSQAEKRAHHNALERKRRDHIKDSFSSLRDSVPALNGEKVASRAQILKKAAEYIVFMRKKNNSHQQDIEDLKRQNSLLEAQIFTCSSHGLKGKNRKGLSLGSAQAKGRIIPQKNIFADTDISTQVQTLEKAKSTGYFDFDLAKDGLFLETESDTSDTDGPVQQKRPKKLKSFH